MVLRAVGPATMQEDEHKTGANYTPWRGILFAMIPVAVAFVAETKWVIAAGFFFIILMLNEFAGDLRRRHKAAPHQYSFERAAKRPRKGIAIMGLFDWFNRKQDDVTLAFTVDGTETLRYGETREVIDTLQGISSALALYPIKETARRDSDPKWAWLYEFTDGMSSEEVEKYFNGTIELMDLLNNGAVEPLHIEGTIKIISGRILGGVLLNQHTPKSDSGQSNINFPYGGISYTTPEGLKHDRVAKRDGDDLRLEWVVDGRPELVSVVIWTVGLTSGRISLSVKEATYWQVKDYGRVLRNQVWEATGTVQRGALAEGGE